MKYLDNHIKSHFWMLRTGVFLYKLGLKRLGRWFLDEGTPPGLVYSMETK